MQSEEMELGHALVRNAFEETPLLLTIIIIAIAFFVGFICFCIYVQKRRARISEVFYSPPSVESNNHTGNYSPSPDTDRGVTEEDTRQQDPFLRPPCEPLAAPVVSEPPIVSDGPQAEQERRTAVNRLVDTMPMFVAGPSYAKDHCPICLDTLEDKPISIGTCMHAAHTECLSSYLAKMRHELCPVCRSPLLITESAQSYPSLTA